MKIAFGECQIQSARSPKRETHSLTVTRAGEACVVWGHAAAPPNSSVRAAPSPLRKATWCDRDSPWLAASSEDVPAPPGLLAPGETVSASQPSAGHRHRGGGRDPGQQPRSQGEAAFAPAWGTGRWVTGRDRRKWVGVKWLKVGWPFGDLTPLRPPCPWRDRV